MDQEQLQQMITAATREAIYAQLNPPPEQVNESLTVSIVAGLGLSAAIGVAINQYIKNKELKTFINDNIPNYDTETKELFRKFSYVNSLSDLDKIENEIESYTDKLDGLHKVIDNKKPNTKDGQHIRNALKTGSNWSVKKHLTSYVKELKSAFVAEIDERRRKMDSSR